MIRSSKLDAHIIKDLTFNESDFREWVLRVKNFDTSDDKDLAENRSRYENEFLWLERQKLIRKWWVEQFN